MNDTQLIENISDIILRISYAKASYGYSAENIIEYFDTASEEQIVEDYFEDLILENNVSEEYIIEQVDIVMEGLGSFLAGKVGIGLIKKLLPKRIASKLSVGKVIKKALPAAGLTAVTVAALNPELTKSVIQKGTKETKETLSKIKDTVTNALNPPDESENKEGEDKDKGKEEDSASDGKSMGLNPMSKPEPETLSPKQIERERKYNIMKKSEIAKKQMEAYDVILDYLLSEGHADTVEEAHYVMMQMDAKHIQSICEMRPAPMPNYPVGNSNRVKPAPMPTPGNSNKVKPAPMPTYSTYPSGGGKK